MSSTAPNPGRGRAGLLEKLLAAIRPEFRTEIYRPAADDPVFIVPPRAVLDCDRVVSQRVLAAAQGRSVAVEFNGSYRHRPPQPHGSRSLRAAPLTINGS
ncbi:hypothetical protein [Streptomyces sp. NPDC059744]|uniref:hypothetical protein n=1 Tax=Streptomyces sp. NPDC059744 TaxID=3346929 RepID=UPI00364A245C